MTTAEPCTASHAHPDPLPAAARRRWPLLAIGASAGTATWSGWVGLGELTGFGIVHPLPGIWDDLTINTAVTLPIGVEAYAMYALSIATSARPLPVRVRRYAWASSAAALLLGMAGQVAYHLMTAHTPTTVDTYASTPLAPWWVIAVVSCLPVLVLGAASLLWHLAAPADPIVPVAIGSCPDPIQWPAVGEPVTGPDRFKDLALTDWAVTDRAVTDRVATDWDLTDWDVTDPEVTDRLPVTSTSNSAPVAPKSVGAAAPESLEPAPRPGDLERVREAIAAGHLPPRPTARAIRMHLAIGTDPARAVRDALATTQQAHGQPHDQAEPAALAAPSLDATDAEPAPAPHPHSGPEEQPQDAFQNPETEPAEEPDEPSQPLRQDPRKNAEPRTQPLTEGKTPRAQTAIHTYASRIE